MTRKWNDLNHKIAAAAAVMIGLDLAAILGWVNGDLTWRQFAVAVLGIDLPVIAGYLAKESG